MEARDLDVVRFAAKPEGGFFATVTTKVNSYFASNSISPFANTQIWVKIVIAPIVKSTAAAFGLPYHELPGFFKALREHTNMLKTLGRV